MKKILGLMILILAVVGVGFSQKPMPDRKPFEMADGGETKKPTDADKTAVFDKNGNIKRGAPLSPKAKKVSLAKVLKTPTEYTGKTVRVEGVIVRSCKMEGCWMELAPNKDAKSVRVKMKDHAFFIPLDAAGLNAKAEGVFSVKVLSKAEVDHLIEDGAKFDNRNADGSVTEIAFEATGVELRKK
ncbi:MAG: DUF4920 domain-containing protein [Acidobacteriota bacterium]|nr:DUF4920 domain-containing protein [Acidobacteriota bacterium]